jgi:enoyl-CoA hydratase
MIDTETVIVERRKLGIDDAAMGLVTLNRPAEMNQLDWDTVHRLDKALGEFAKDASVRVVAVTGAGSAFSAGGDMKKYPRLQRDPIDYPQFLVDIHATFGRIAYYPKAHIALVNGVAVAGGIELILSCDLAFAAESARIGDAHLALRPDGRRRRFDPAPARNRAGEGARAYPFWPAAGSCGGFTLRTR